MSNFHKKTHVRKFFALVFGDKPNIEKSCRALGSHAKFPGKNVLRRTAMPRTLHQKIFERLWGELIFVDIQIPNGFECEQWAIRVLCNFWGWEFFFEKWGNKKFLNKMGGLCSRGTINRFYFQHKGLFFLTLDEIPDQRSEKIDVRENFSYLVLSSCCYIAQSPYGLSDQCFHGFPEIDWFG